MYEVDRKKRTNDQHTKSMFDFVDSVFVRSYAFIAGLRPSRTFQASLESPTVFKTPNWRDCRNKCGRERLWREYIAQRIIKSKRGAFYEVNKK